MHIELRFEVRRKDQYGYTLKGFTEKLKLRKNTGGEIEECIQGMRYKRIGDG